MSQYLQRLNITSVEEVGVDNIVLPHYQQIVEVVEVVDNDGNPWEPVPGPDPWDELVWVNKSSTTGSTVLGSVLTGNPGTVTGGAPPVVVVSQWQRSATTSGFAGFTPWEELGSTPDTYTTTVTDNAKYVRLATKATDADGTVYYGSGNSVGPMTPSIGTVVITPSSRSLSVGVATEFTASVTGGTATDFLYNWTVRSGDADLMSENNTSSTVLYEFNTVGSVQIQCYIASNGASNTPQSAVATIIVS